MHQPNFGGDMEVRNVWATLRKKSIISWAAFTGESRWVLPATHRTSQPHVKAEIFLAEVLANSCLQFLSSAFADSCTFLPCGHMWKLAAGSIAYALHWALAYHTKLLQRQWLHNVVISFKCCRAHSNSRKTSPVTQNYSAGGILKFCFQLALVLPKQTKQPLWPHEPA